ncbi:MAG: C40 family peptidase [Clostridia bacterium]|nr:C40 family peptidase [Clostridia bacterium]
MKKAVISGILSLLLLSFSAPALAATAGTVTGDRVNFRTDPTLSAPRMAYLYKGDAVSVQWPDGDWYRIKYNGMTGYVHGDYVSVSSASGTLLRQGSRGSEIAALQEKLILLGYLNDTADGIFGAKTLAAVKKYQSVNGLGVDGIAGPVTLAAVKKEYDTVQSIVTYAKKFLGTKYVYGGNTPEEGFDCSGFTKYVYRNAAGIDIERVSYNQAKQGFAVSYSKMRPGDLVAFNSPVSHVGIYLGNNKFIHAPKPGDVVKITDLKYMELTAIRRFTGKVPW